MILRTLLRLFDVGIGLYGFALLAVLVALTAIYISVVGVEQAMPRPTPNVQNPPMYPNAENVKWGDDVMLSGVLGEEMQEVAIGRVLTFDTTDPPEAVVSYYKEAMPKEGWSPPSQPEIESNRLVFSYSERKWLRKTRKIYVVMVEVTSISDQRTSVKVTMLP